MENSNADISEIMAVEGQSQPRQKKKPGRKPTVFEDNKPIDPKYYVNYYHDVIKKKEHLCPYCSKKFACQYNVSRHLNNKRKACALQHLAEKIPEMHEEPSDHISDVMDEETDDETSSTTPFYPKANIPDNNPIINEFLNFYADKPAPKTVAEWNQAGWLMLNMVLNRQRELISNRSPLSEHSTIYV